MDLLRNQARVLHGIARNPSVRVRELAAAVGVTERTAQSILAELISDGYVRRERIGRRNRYHVERGRPLEPPVGAHTTLGSLLDALDPPAKQLSRAAGDR